MAKYTGPVYTHCDRCSSTAPGQVVRFFHDGHEEALCYSCWNPLTWTGGIGVGQCKVLHWINAYGRLMFAPGAAVAPRNH